MSMTPPNCLLSKLPSVGKFFTCEREKPISKDLSTPSEESLALRYPTEETGDCTPSLPGVKKTVGRFTVESLDIGDTSLERMRNENEKLRIENEELREKLAEKDRVIAGLTQIVAAADGHVISAASLASLLDPVEGQGQGDFSESWHTHHTYTSVKDWHEFCSLRILSGRHKDQLSFNASIHRHVRTGSRIPAWGIIFGSQQSLG